MKLVRLFLAAILTSALVGCGDNSHDYTPVTVAPPVGQPGIDGVVVRSRTVYLLTTEGGQPVAKKLYTLVLPIAYAANPTSTTITVVNAPNASMTVSSTALVAPTITNSLLQFGSLSVTALTDNQLKVCGTNGNQKCGTAVIRMYTTGSGAGFWNSTDGYGVPINAGRGTSRSSVGLGALNAAIVQTYTIPSSKNVVRDTDFASPMTYNVESDFTDAGAGSYSATLVVEYGLAL